MLTTLPNTHCIQLAFDQHQRFVSLQQMQSKKVAVAARFLTKACFLDQAGLGETILDCIDWSPSIHGKAIACIRCFSNLFQTTA